MNTGPAAPEAGALRPLTPSPRLLAGRGWGEGQRRALIVVIGSAQLIKKRRGVLTVILEALLLQE